MVGHGRTGTADYLEFSGKTTFLIKAVKGRDKLAARKIPRCSYNDKDAWVGRRLKEAVGWRGFSESLALHHSGKVQI
jgi:hypothetical protein